VAREKRVHGRQVAPVGQFDGDHRRSSARGAQQEPPVGVSSTYSCPKAR
jgi:hypothetical protein